MKKLIPIGFTIIALNYGCKQYEFTTFRLCNLKDTSFYFQSKLLHPTLLEISIRVYSDNPFVINNIRLEGGKIDTLLKMDWYGDTVIINFKRYKAAAGNLTFNCRTY